MSDLLRTIRTGRFVVEFRAHSEYVDPADTIATDEDAADAAYCESIYRGDLPWFCLGVHVLLGRAEIGASYLGCVDTLDLRDIGVRDIVHDAIREARLKILEVQLIQLRELVTTEGAR